MTDGEVLQGEIVEEVVDPLVELRARDLQGILLTMGLLSMGIGVGIGMYIGGVVVPRFISEAIGPKPIGIEFTREQINTILADRSQVVAFRWRGIPREILVRVVD